MAVRREDVTFESGGERIAAWFYAGEGDGPSRRPCVVLGHGFAAVKEARLDAFAGRFAGAGLACIVFDYRHFGGSGGEPRQLVDIKRQQEDWLAALRYARSLDRVDSDRVAVWGTSFGGAHAIEVAVRDGRVKAAVLQVPLVDVLASSAGTGLWHTAMMTYAGLRDALHGLLRRPPYMIRVIGPPGSMAFLSTPESEPGYRAIVVNAPSWRNDVCARIVLRMPFFRPTAKVARLPCPALFVIGTRDTLTPCKATLAAARKAPRARVLELPVGHFEAYVGAAFEQAVAAETEFLLETLGAGAPCKGS